MVSFLKDPIVVIFIDADNKELARLYDPRLLPRVGENVRLDSVPYVVERVGYDIPDGAIDRVWMVCRPA
jgi:hypothetical protein